MTRLSGWCAPAPGMSHTRREHLACRSEVCGCPEHGGHQRPVVDSESRLTTVALVAPRWDNGHAASTANEAARATAAKRSPGQSEPLIGSDPA